MSSYANLAQRNCRRRECDRLFPYPRPNSRRLLRQSEDRPRTVYLIRRAIKYRWPYHRPRNALLVSIRALCPLRCTEDRGALPILQYFGGAVITYRTGRRLRDMGGIWRKAILLPAIGGQPGKHRERAVSSTKVQRRLVAEGKLMLRQDI